MARRKEVFESKVLKKLYPAAPKLEGKSSSCTVETLAKKTCVKRKLTPNDAGAAGKTGAGAGRRMYTVLPPPADYKADPERSVPLPEPEGIKNGEDAAEESDRDKSSEESGQDGEEEVEEKRKRKRRKRKPALRQGYGEGAGPGGGSGPGTGQTQTPVDGPGERISKNKRRKLKKKRHKEKLLSMGLMPRAAALEFTYRKDGEEEEEEEEEDNEKRAAEVSHFLRTTMEIYKSDSSLRGSDELAALSATLDDLLSSLAGGHRPASVLRRLHGLRVCAGQRQTDELEEALEELRHTSLLAAEETTAVVLLFQYWITDILPMQEDRMTELSDSHP